MKREKEHKYEKKLSKKERQIVAYNIKRIRKKNGLSQEELAEKDFKSVRSIQRLEKDGTGINKFYDVIDYAELLNCDVSELFEPRLSPEILSLRNMIENFDEYTQPHLNLKDIKIQNISDLFIYTPLIEPRLLLDYLADKSLCLCDMNDKGFYVISNLNHLYNSIKNKEARKYADYLSSCRYITEEGKIKQEIEDRIKKSIFEGTSFERCKTQYYNERDNYVKIISFYDSFSKVREKYEDNLKMLHPKMQKLLRLDQYINPTPSKNEKFLNDLAAKIEEIIKKNS